MFHPIKSYAKSALYWVLKHRPTEQALIRAYALAHGTPGAEKRLVRWTPQPSSYRAPDVRKVVRYGAQWHLHPAHYFQWHHYFGLRDDVLEALRRLAKDARVMVDVGANIGLYSLVVALENPGLEVHAFEPNPRTFRQLERHVTLNGSPSVSCHRLALGAETRTQEVFDPGGDCGKFSLRTPNSGEDDALEITVKTLDDFVESTGLTALDVLKVDVEGLEPEVFAGARSSIERFRPKLCFELSPAWYDTSQMDPFDLLVKDYAFYWIQEGRTQAVDLKRILDRQNDRGSGDQFNLVGIPKAATR